MRSEQGRGVCHPLPLAWRGVHAKPQVYLVGAGPGDPDLLTLKAVRVLEQADTVVYDRLIGAGILDLAPPGRRVYVGKTAGRPGMTQDRINRLLVELAAPGRRVVRLKGGDPFMFGRGGEEALHLLRHGIPVEVVPGRDGGPGLRRRRGSRSPTAAWRPACASSPGTAATAGGST